MDMLVKLYNVEDDPALFANLKAEGITFKRAMPPDLSKVIQFAKDHFSDGWGNECTVGVIKNHCWLAVKDHRIVGFACYETTMPDFFGPTGVLPEMRGKGVGKALLLRALLSMKEMGYAYAIIGWTGPAEFYNKCVGATIIPDSIPKSYHNLIALDD